MNTAIKRVLSLSARRCTRAAFLILGALTLIAVPCSGQTPAPVNNGSQLPRRIPPPQEVDPQSSMDPMGTPLFYEKRLKMINAAQHKSMVADTDRLLKLVADLNTQVNSNNSNQLTPDQLRTMAEIEKLAHSVKDKMRMSVRSALDYTGTPPATRYSPR